LKVPRQCQLVLLVEVRLRQGENIKFWVEERSRVVVVLRMIRINFVSTFRGLRLSENWSNIGRTMLLRNLDVTHGRAATEACSATWNFGTSSAFALGSRKITEKLDRVGRSHDLPDADWLLASRSASKYVNPSIRPCICAVALSWKILRIVLQSILCGYFEQWTIVGAYLYTVYIHTQVPQEERSVFWEVIVSIVLSKKLDMYMCPILNGFWDRAISQCSTLCTVQTSNTPCPHTSCKVYWCCWWNFPKCIILGKLYQLCDLNNKYRHWKQYVKSLYYRQFLDLHSEITLSRKPFGIGHMYIRIYNFMLGMTDTVTSQNTDLSLSHIATENCILVI
jgi:hypothetical protein